MNHPIDNVQWIDAGKLDPNDYNPNIVFTPELKLLELSLLTQGWIQPILVNQEQEDPSKLVIIDGFHRHSICMNSSQVHDMTDGKVPCAILSLSEAERMMLTIRINRAKGTHVSIKMHDIAHKLVKELGCSIDQVAKGIGATKAEVQLLLQENVFKKMDTENHKYSKAWYPK